MSNWQEKILILLVGIGIVVALVFVLEKPNPNVLNISVHTIDEKTDLYDIHAEYPQFPRLAKTFNTEIESKVTNAIADFKKSVDENEKARTTTAGADSMPHYQYSFILGWTPQQLTPSFVSMVMRIYFFTGGAHGGHDLYTFNYDIKAKNEPSLSQIFASAPNYLEKISQFAIDDLKNSLRVSSGGVEPNMDMIQNGASPMEENFSKFTLGSDNTITFYFPQYQVAPYSYGEQSVTMPLSYVLNK